MEMEQATELTFHTHRIPEYRTVSYRLKTTQIPQILIDDTLVLTNFSYEFSRKIL